MASEAFPRSQELFPKLNKQTKKKKNSKGAFNLEQSALPTKDCKSRARSCGAGREQVPPQSPGLGRRGGGQHGLMLWPLARAQVVVLRMKAEVRAAARAGRWSPVSAARASGGPRGAARGCAPGPPDPLRSFPAGQLDPASEEFATTPSPLTLTPIACLAGLILEEIDGFSSSSLMCFFAPLRGKRNVYLKLKGTADGARGQSPSSARPHLPARRY